MRRRQPLHHQFLRDLESQQESMRRDPFFENRRAAALYVQELEEYRTGDFVKPSPANRPAGLRDSFGWDPFSDFTVGLSFRLFCLRGSSARPVGNPRPVIIAWHITQKHLSDKIGKAVDGL